MDQAGFKELFDGYAKKIYNFTLWIVRDKEVSDDIVQAVFIKLWNKSHNPQDEKGIVWWLYQVARTECMDYFRKESRFSSFQNRYTTDSPEPLPDEALERKIVWEKLGALNEQERTILFLRMREGYSYKEIGENLGIQESTVRTKAFRALARLRKEFIEEPV
jgi:RNA polymerase sigma-70 factor (ECF subfamily)